MSRLIQITEHEILTVGRSIQGTQLSLRDYKCLFRWNTRQEVPFITIGYNQIKFSQYVGVILVNDLTIEVLPKLGKGSNQNNNIWKNLLLHMLKQSGKLNLKLTDKAFLSLQNTTLIDLYIYQFLTEIELLLRKGLLKKYRKQQENSTTLKGKLLISKQIEKNVVHKEQFYMETTVYDYDHLLNQIIKTALLILNQTRFSNPGLRKKLNEILFYFDKIKPVREIISWDRIIYDRKSAKYKYPITLSRLIIENKSPNLSSGKQEILAFLFDMNRLYEEYIYQECKRYLGQRASISIRNQTVKKFWKNSRIIPDIVFKQGEHSIVLDTKWKIYKKHPSAADLMQMYTYGTYWNAKIVVLIYPCEEESIIETDGIYSPAPMTNNNEIKLLIFKTALIKKESINYLIGEELIDKIMAYKN